MSIPPEYARTPSRVDPAVLREFAAVLLILAGLAGLVVAAFMISAALGVATVSAATIAAGVILGLDR